MFDPLTAQQRHECMSHIRSKDTRPEVRLRKALFARGYRYRVNKKGLPGRPDVVLAKYHTCVFVNGCFWHGHEGCGKYVMPKTNVEFWRAKVANNRERDLRNYRDLEALGWRVVVVWECELAASVLAETVSRVERQLEENRLGWEAEREERRARRVEWEGVLRRRKEREASECGELEKYNLPKAVVRLSKAE